MIIVGCFLSLLAVKLEYSQCSLVLSAVPGFETRELKNDAR